MCLHTTISMGFENLQFISASRKSDVKLHIVAKFVSLCDVILKKREKKKREDFVELLLASFIWPQNVNARIEFFDDLKCLKTTIVNAHSTHAHSCTQSSSSDQHISNFRFVHYVHIFNYIYWYICTSLTHETCEQNQCTNMHSLHNNTIYKWI